MSDTSIQHTSTPTIHDAVCTVLLVEDDDALAGMLKRGLSQAGFQVIEAHDGTTAIHLMQSGQIHAVLLDLRLPDMTGLDVLRVLRADACRQPILIVTARTEECNRIVGLELGADDYIVKPVGLGELIARVRAALRRVYGGYAPLSANRHRHILFGDVDIDVDAMTA